MQRGCQADVEAEIPLPESLSRMRLPAPGVPPSQSHHGSAAGRDRARAAAGAPGSRRSRAQRRTRQKPPPALRRGCHYHPGGNGPWILADLEAGTFPSNLNDDPNNTSIAAPSFATLMLKGFSGNRFALKAGDAQSGSLITKWAGARPDGYTPMQKQGGLGLGSGGEGSHESTGLFFEGAVTIGCSDDDSVDDAIHANIVAAGYGL